MFSSGEIFMSHVMDTIWTLMGVALAFLLVCRVILFFKEK